MKFKDNLNEKIWNLENNDMLPEVKEKLFEIANAFIEYIEVPQDAVLDMVVTGSSASYNYNKYSDLDLHIIVDYDKIHEDCPLVEGYLGALKNTFNKEHDIFIHGVPVELYAEKKDQGTVHNGLYSLNTGWIDFPKKIEPTDNDAAVEAKYKEIKEMIDKCDDSEAADELLEKIYNMRKAGLAEAGEFGTENLAFKKLRNEGCMDKLRKLKKEKIDKQLSLESYNETLEQDVKELTKTDDYYKVDGSRVSIKNGFGSQVELMDLQNLGKKLEKKGYKVYCSNYYIDAKKNESVNKTLTSGQTLTIQGIWNAYEHGLVTKERTLQRYEEYLSENNMAEGDLIWAIGKDKWDHLHNIMTGNPELDDDLNESLNEENFKIGDRVKILVSSSTVSGPRTGTIIDIKDTDKVKVEVDPTDYLMGRTDVYYASDLEKLYESIKESEDDLTNFCIIVDGDYGWLKEYGVFKSAEMAQNWLEKNGEEDWMYSQLTKGEMKDLGIDEFGYVNESINENNWQRFDSDEDELEQENNRSPRYYYGETRDGVKLLVKGKDSEEVIKKAKAKGYNYFIPDITYSSADKCNRKYDKLIESMEEDKFKHLDKYLNLLPVNKTKYISVDLKDKEGNIEKGLITISYKESKRDNPTIFYNFHVDCIKNDICQDKAYASLIINNIKDTIEKYAQKHGLEIIKTTSYSSKNESINKDNNLTESLNKTINEAVDEKTIYSPRLISQAYEKEHSWYKSENSLDDNGDLKDLLPQVMLFIIEDNNIIDTKLIDRKDVYTYKPNDNEYYLDRIRDTGYVLTDYNLEPAQKLVDRWNESKKWENIADSLCQIDLPIKDEFIEYVDLYPIKYAPELIDIQFIAKDQEGNSMPIYVANGVIDSIDGEWNTFPQVKWNVTHLNDKEKAYYIQNEFTKFINERDYKLDELKKVIVEKLKELNLTEINESQEEIATMFKITNFLKNRGYKVNNVTKEGLKKTLSYSQTNPIKDSKQKLVTGKSLEEILNKLKDMYGSMNEKVEETKNYKRTRLCDPKTCKKDSFRTKQVNNKGDKIILCQDKETGKMKTQSKLIKKQNLKEYEELQYGVEYRNMHDGIHRLFVTDTKEKAELILTYLKELETPDTTVYDDNEIMDNAIFTWEEINKLANDCFDVDYRETENCEGVYDGIYIINYNDIKPDIYESLNEDYGEDRVNKIEKLINEIDTLASEETLEQSTLNKDISKRQSKNAIGVLNNAKQELKWYIDAQKAINKYENSDIYESLDESLSKLIETALKDSEIKILVKNVRWDADEEEDIKDLPTEFYLEVKDTDEETISDAITNEYGFTHKGFDYEIV